MQGGNDAFGALIARSLHEDADRLRLGGDFASRLKAGLRPRRSFPRWLGVAAAVAVVLGAAWPVAELIFPGFGDSVEVRRIAALSGASFKSVGVPSAEIESEPIFAFLRKDTCSFWNTGVRDMITVPIDFPAGSRRARLTVTGRGYTVSYENILDDEFTFRLPAVAPGEAEEVYDLTLAFDDSTVRQARLGLVRSVTPDHDGTTSCLASQSAKIWEAGMGRYAGYACADSCLLIVK